MAITILNEWDFTEGSVTSDIHTPYFKPIVYYRALKASVAYSTFSPDNGTTIFRAIKVDEDATYFYYIFNGEDYFKYEIFETKSDLPPWVSTHGFDYTSTLGTYDKTYDFLIKTYDSSDVQQETFSDSFSITTLFGQKLPSPYGFNLFELYTFDHLMPLKWSNNTFNTFFTYIGQFGLGSRIRNLTTGKTLFDSAPSNAGLSYMYFPKKVQDIWLSTDSRTFLKPGDKTGAKVYSLGTWNPGEIESVELTFDKTIFADDGSTGNESRLVFSYTSLPDDVVSATQQKDGNVNKIKLEGTPQNVVAENVTVKFVPDFASVYLNDHIYASDIKALATFSTDYQEQILAPGINQIELSIAFSGGFYTFNKILEIDYDPYGCYVDLMFDHPQLGYVSYPFEGMKVEGLTSSKGIELEPFQTTMVDVNLIKQIQGYTANETITLSTQVDKKYWDLVKEIYNSRHVYMYVGENGDVDDQVNWVSVEVTGTPSINYNTQKTAALFTVNLKLPEKFNNRL